LVSGRVADTWCAQWFARELMLNAQQFVPRALGYLN
jgi:hypothetical protein